MTRSSFDIQDVQVTTFKASGPGGQNRNKRETGIRVVHLPTGTTVTNADQRSQLQNKNLALAELKNRLDKENTLSVHQEVNEQRVQGTENRSFTWTEWRDEVKSSSGSKASYKQVLKGRLQKLLK